MDRERLNEVPGAIEDQAAEVEGHLTRGIERGPGEQAAGELGLTDLTPGVAGAAGEPEVAGHGLQDLARGATEGDEQDEAARDL